MSSNEYTCYACKQTFTYGWSIEEAEKEFHEEFPKEDLSKTRIVCDDCYKEIMIWMRRKKWEKNLF
jgi:DNA-directed RNA polymerase subunit RPC12/RpoP